MEIAERRNRQRRQARLEKRIRTLFILPEFIENRRAALLFYATTAIEPLCQFQLSLRFAGAGV